MGAVHLTDAPPAATIHPEPSPRFGPADRVTLVRAVLVGLAAVLTVESLRRHVDVVAPLVIVSTSCLVLDGADGWVARRTGTVSDFGARFDMETDAVLLLVLSGYLVPQLGTWVLLIGATRYLYGLAGLLWPFLHDPVPPRRWRKAVAVLQGVALTVVVAGVLPAAVNLLALRAALLLLALSFLTQAWYVWRHRDRAEQAVSARSTLVLSIGLVWLALVVPDDVVGLSWWAPLRMPLEALLLVGLALLLPRRTRAPVALGVGLLLGLLTVLAVLDLGFTAALGRTFNPLQDVSYVDSAFGLLSDSVGRSPALVVSVALAGAVVGLLVLMPLAVLRVTRAVHVHRDAWWAALPVLLMAWVLLGALGVHAAPHIPIASASAFGIARDQVRQVDTAWQDRQTFASALTDDPFADTPGAGLLNSLRGKDVLIVFVESYGRVAVEGSSISDDVDRVLDSGSARLRAAGFAARSAYLTSPTFGGISWLAHSTLQSGLWVDSQQRYDRLVTQDRLTLSGAFGRAGWRTVGVVPSNTQDWPEGTAFYGYDAVYDARDLGYAGPSYSYATMPDQYVLAALQRLELAPAHRQPVMAEVDLVSSHTPWAPLPSPMPWAAVGDGSVFDGQPAMGLTPQEVWPDPDQVRAAYAQSIQYSLETIISFVETYGTDDLVLLVLGDHQPASVVSGRGAGHEVPVTLVARDPSVLAPISSWHWTAGLRPLPSAPVWRMDSMRDRFLTAFSSPR